MNPSAARWVALAKGLALGLGLGAVVALGLAGYRFRDEWFPGPGRRVAKLEVFPARVGLWHAADRQALVVQATLENGVTRDVTGRASFRWESGGAASTPARWDAGSLVPAADGHGELRVRYAGREVRVPVTVTNATTARGVSFRNDVMPVFMRAGCNGGACHGAARGRDGFRLSLFGYDPAGDHERITREMATRRVNLALPRESLLVLKGAGKVPHAGGERFDEHSEECETLVRWLAANAPDDPKDLPSPVSMEILPRQLVLEGEGTTHRMTVVATYSDGTTRDVTRLCLFLSNNDVSARMGPDGVVTAGRRGEAFVMARFATFTVGAQAIVIPKGLRYEWPQEPEAGEIDRWVHDKLRKLRILPSGLCTDEEFVRRVHLDVVGLLPTRADTERFLADAAPDKRARLVAELVGRKEFVELWTMQLAELLRIRSDGNQQMSQKAALLYFNWLSQRLEAGDPIDRIVRDLLSATGGTFANPASNFYQVEQDTLKLSENVAQAFMGMRLQCAQCHNHPFDRWTMDDYYGFAAFFGQVGRKAAQDPRERIVFNAGSGDVKHPVGGRAMAPKFLGDAVPDVTGKDRRAVVAEWLASPGNPWFARNVVNRVWAHFMGAGIVEPVDDVRVSNPASNPELLDALARRFTESGYNLRALVADICNSRAYQRSTRSNESNEGDSRNASHALVRRIRAEVLLDAISQVTGTRNKFPGLPLGARAVQIADGNVETYFLTTFGRAKRESVCSCEVKMEPNLSQALHLLMGDATNQRIPDGGVVATALKAGRRPSEVIEDLYLRCLSRKPTARELEDLLARVPQDKPREALEDVFWSLLNSKEFVFNH